MINAPELAGEIDWMNPLSAYTSGIGGRALSREGVT